MEIKYYTFADFLSNDKKNVYFDLHPLEQIELFERYLNFLENKKLIIKNTKKKSIAFATLKNEIEIKNHPILKSVLEGTTLSGFGAIGTNGNYLSQKELSIQTAYVCLEIKHTFKTEQKDTILNSRSFYFYWCHAEKQKIVAIRMKIQNDPNKKSIWEYITIHVDRIMCDDCIEFIKNLAVFDQVVITVMDPKTYRIFNTDGKIDENTM